MLISEQERRARLKVGYTAYADRPSEFVKEVLGEHLWSKQIEIAEALTAHRKVAVQSCHGPGKSFLAARIVTWFISTAAPGTARAVTTAPTGDQVRGVLWTELNQALIRASARGLDLPGRTTSVEWWIDRFQAAVGRKSADWNASAFQGWHARRLLVLMDEACGCSEQLWIAADSLATSDESRILAIGNPDDPASHFATVCKPGSGWHVIKISAFDTPNFTDEKVPAELKQVLTSRYWVEDKRKTWGEASPLWQSKVLGEFPDIGDDTLIPPGWLNAALDRYKDGSDEDEDPEDIELGVDVARFGADETVITLRRGKRARIHSTLHQRDLMEVCGAIVQAIKETGCRCCKVDDAGLGGGVTDRLFELQGEGIFGDQMVDIVPVNVGMATSDADDRERGDRGEHERFLNLRAELHWGIRKRFELGTIAIEADEDLMGQAVAIRYKLNSRGLVQIESKDDMKRRGLVSPDRFDALVLCFAEGQSRSWRAWQSLHQERA